MTGVLAYSEISARLGQIEYKRHFEKKEDNVHSFYDVSKVLKFSGH